MKERTLIYWAILLLPFIAAGLMAIDATKLGTLAFVGWGLSLVALLFNRLG